MCSLHRGREARTAMTQKDPMLATKYVTKGLVTKETEGTGMNV